MDRTIPQLAGNPARPAAAAPAHKRWGKFAKRAAWAGAGLVAIALIIFFMLPVWISNEQGRTYVLSRINKRINGTLTVSNWKLGWFRGTEIENLTLTLPDGRQLLRCPKISTDLTLWSLLWGNYDLGNTRLENPQLIAANYGDGSSDFTRMVRPGTTGPNPLRTLRGNIVCERGLIQLTSPAGGAPLALSDVAADIPIASHTAPIHVKVTGLTYAGGVTRSVNAVADLPSPSTWEENPAALLTNVHISAAGVPTSALAEWIGLDARWEKSMGPVITELSFVSQPQPDAVSSLVNVSAHGSGGQVRARLRMVARGREVRLSAIDPRDICFDARIGASAPVVELLRHVNPIFATLEKTDGPIQVEARDFQIDAQHPASATGTLYVLLPAATLRDAGLMHEVLALSQTSSSTPRPPATRPAEPLAAMADLLKLTLAEQRVSYADMGLTLASRQRLVFSGSVGFDSSVDLVLTLPLPRAFGSATLQIPIKGTVEKPQLEVLRFTTPPAK